VIRTRAICSPALKMTPRNDELALPAGPTGTLKLPSAAPKESKNWRLELFARSTSVNTTPKPVIVAATVPLVPGIENVASVREVLRRPVEPAVVRSQSHMSALGR